MSVHLPLTAISWEDGKATGITEHDDGRVTAQSVQLPNDVLLIKFCRYPDGSQEVEEIIKWSDFTAFKVARLKDETQTCDRVELSDCRVYTSVAYPTGDWTAKRIEWSDRIEHGVKVTAESKMIERVEWKNDGGTAWGVTQHTDGRTTIDRIENGDWFEENVTMAGNRWTNKEEAA